MRHRRRRCPSSSFAELEHRLARQDHFLARDSRRRSPMLAHDSRWPSVATACSVRLVDDEQHAVQVIADVLLRHRELDELEQRAQVASAAATASAAAPGRR